MAAAPTTLHSLIPSLSPSFQYRHPLSIGLSPSGVRPRSKKEGVGVREIGATAPSTRSGGARNRRALSKGETRERKVTFGQSCRERRSLRTLAKALPFFGFSAHSFSSHARASVESSTLVLVALNTIVHLVLTFDEQMRMKIFEISEIQGTC